MLAESSKDGGTLNVKKICYVGRDLLFGLDVGLGAISASYAVSNLLRWPKRHH